MSEQHTPGPWRAECPAVRWRIRNAEGHFIFEELGRGAEVRREADARLIAAAPDLLAALKDMVDLANALNAWCMSRGVPIAMPVEYQFVAEGIAKAQAVLSRTEEGQ